MTPRRRLRSSCATSTSRSRPQRRSTPRSTRTSPTGSSASSSNGPPSARSPPTTPGTSSRSSSSGCSARAGVARRACARAPPSSTRRRPLTPAPFEGSSTDAAVSDEFESFAWGNAVTPEQAPPGPATPPPSDSAPVPPEPTVGPPTPAPGPAVGGAPATSDGGFVTFGAPAAPEEAAEAPLAEAPAARAAPPAEPSSHPATEEEGFETYVAPAPLRPPADDAPPEAPALPEPAAAAPSPPPAPAPAPPAPAPAATAAREEELAPTVMPSSVKPAAGAAPPPAPPRQTGRPAAVAAEPRERRSGRGLRVGFGIAAVTAVFLGIVVGGAGKGGTDESSGGTPTNAASNADVEALFPAGWSTASRAPAIPGMTVSDAVAMAPRDGGQNVVVGEVKQGAANSTLLPTRFLSALALDPGEVPPRQPVRLARAKLQAWRYENLRPRGLAKPVTIFTAPTSAGVATVACVDPGADCEAIANTLKLKAGTAFPVGPSKAYAAALGKRLSGLNKQVRAGRTALRRAKTPKAQAAAVGRLAAAYTGASAAISRLDVSPADQATQAQLAKALKGTGQAYRRLAAAAGSGRKAAFAKARAGARRNEQAVAGALRGLQAAGYKVAE